ncbi:uncharacterized protein LOC115473360 [Microcaecilia unicolor]|uniref:Uncharacterized protein LOC115473360 n=1 Tax=Microcaecilia unicolor TaxID=1415580 RepID=A0A6P7YM30_9AMPH|nr:uncharacterized protein LOC115473360 [Microcaecilia unicolor]
MTGKEPLLGTLKACILSIQASGSCSITDSCPHLASLCEILEMILRKGIKQPVLGFKKRDYWHWLEQLSQQDMCGKLTQLPFTIEKVSSCKKVLTAQGRGRFFLRLALNKKLLGITIQHLAHTPKLLEWYDPLISVLGNEEFMEPFHSMMLVVTEINFSLDLENSSFLDDSWLLPVCETYETVPCRELGMVLRYLDGRIFIVEVLPGSQAEIDELVLVGDIIDEINGISLRNAQNGQAGTVLQKLRDKPLSFRLIRWKWHDGTLYRPLMPYLKVIQEKLPTFQLQHEPKHLEESEDSCLQDGRLMYMLRYLGQASVGLYGGKEVLDAGIPMVLEQRAPSREVLFDVKETEVIVKEKTSSKVLFHYPYPEISCVGRRLDNNNIFAFCIMNSSEPVDQSTFECLVFETHSAMECEEIIRRIATGFKHTEWFV